MKKVVLIVCLIGSIGVARSQEARTYTDEELKSYAGVMVWGELEKSKMTDTYNNWINNNEDLEAARFVKIKNNSSDSLKLQELEVTEEEMAAFSGIMTSYDSMTAAFIDVLKAEIKEKIGYGLYNDLKKDLKKNEEVKSRYQAIFDELKNDAIAEEDDESEE